MVRFRTLLIVVALCLGFSGSIVFLTPVASGAQVTSQQKTPSDLVITVVGRIVETDEGYAIQGDAPRELFSIVNPDPGTLKELAKSGRTLTIKGRSVVGDNLFIESIDGRSYGKAENP